MSSCGSSCAMDSVMRADVKRNVGQELTSSGSAVQESPGTLPITSLQAVNKYGLLTTTWKVGSGIGCPGSRERVSGIFRTTTKQKLCQGSLSVPFPTGRAASATTLEPVLRYFHALDHVLQ